MNKLSPLLFTVHNSPLFFQSILFWQVSLNLSLNQQKAQDCKLIMLQGAYLIGERANFIQQRRWYKFFIKKKKNEVENLKYKKLQVMLLLCSQGSKTNLNFQLVNKPSWISPHKLLQSRLINAVYHLQMKNNKGEKRGA